MKTQSCLEVRILRKSHRRFSVESNDDAKLSLFFGDGNICTGVLILKLFNTP